MSAYVILVAAGRSRRFGARSGARGAGPLPKQFRKLGGRPLLHWPLQVFQATPAVRGVALVVASEYVPWAERFVRRGGFSKVVRVVAGGRERADSVRRGFRALPAGGDVVLIHDAARALVARDVVERVIAAAHRTGAALAAWPVPDTLKVSDPAGRFVRKTLPRKNLWLAQTPQGFRRDVADRLLRRSAGRMTDDAQLAESAGDKVELVPGSPRNLKVTLPEDLLMCERLLP